MSLTIQEHHPLTVAYVDVDEMKTVNDKGATAPAMSSCAMSSQFCARRSAPAT